MMEAPEARTLLRKLLNSRLLNSRKLSFAVLQHGKDDLDQQTQGSSFSTTESELSFRSAQCTRYRWTRCTPTSDGIRAPVEQPVHPNGPE
jgi:hypothetical protein